MIIVEYKIIFFIILISLLTLPNFVLCIDNTNRLVEIDVLKKYADI
jgi:hypothetical protein